MHSYRDAQEILVCDTCYKEIVGKPVNDNPETSLRHFCSLVCGSRFIHPKKQRALKGE